jgi:hypothetical protein
VTQFLIWSKRRRCETGAQSQYYWMHTLVAELRLWKSKFRNCARIQEVCQLKNSLAIAKFLEKET